MTTQMIPVFRVVPNDLVPDSRDKQGHALRLKVTILVTPSLVVDPLSKVQLDLENWPSKIAGWLAEKDYKLDLYLQKVEVQKAVRPICDQKGEQVTATLGPLKSAHNPKDVQGDWLELDKKWQEIFGCAWAKCAKPGPGNQEELWTELKKALEHTNKDQGFTMGLEATVPVRTDEQIKGNLNPDGSLKGGGSGQGQPETITTVLPVGHAYFAEQLEKQRGKKVTDAISHREAPPRDRHLTKAEYQARLDKLKKASTTPDPETKQPLLPIQAARLGKAYRDTVSARQRMKLHYDKIIEDLKETYCHVPSKATPSITSARPEEHLAVHQYGNWPENSNTSDSTLTDAISQTFFALQSSPSLARLFGLVFDAEIEVKDVRHILKSDTPVDGKYLYGFLGPDSNLCEVSRAATAVRLEVDEKDTDVVVGFLPATRAELNLSAVITGPERQEWLDSCDHHSGLVPLSGCLLPTQCSVAGPRFVLTTLDVRRAIDQAMQADIGTQVVDKLPDDDGQRYATAGFCLNDRRRSIGVLEELAFINQAQCDATDKKLTTLYAEDLVVGHVIDVQVYHEKKRDSSSWRSLMERQVSFPGLEKFKEIVRELIGIENSPLRMDLERARISPSTRVMSQPADKDKKDLIVEEAVAMWDGSPMGVDTSPADDVIKQDNVHAVDFVEPPFVRRLDLPTGRSDRRPPPLRYGVSYRFAMRCVYAGGGGLTLDQARRHYQQKTNAFVLPKIEGEGQRFLRNESILSPDVLMLVGDAQRSFDLMGFESSLEVVLRTSNGSLDDKCMFAKNVNDEGYVGLDKRASPKSTTRIIMPPAVGMEDAARHGMFDNTQIGNWRWGAMPLLDYQRGYPKCRDQFERGWNDEQVTVSRSDPTFDTGQGVAAFTLKKKGELKPDQRFYPDPAARYLIIGLYRNGTKKYVPQKEDNLLTRISFYPDVSDGEPLDAKHYTNITPVRLKFEVQEDLLSSRVMVDQHVHWLGGVSEPLYVRNVTVALAPFDEVEVHLWCIPDIKTLKTQFALPRYMQAVDSDGAAQRLWDYVSKVGPVEELGAVQVIKAVHAINRPAVEPDLLLESPATRVRNDDNSSAELVLKGQLQFPTVSADCYELYVRCVSPHSGKFDDDQRGRSLSKRRAGLWPKYTEQKNDESANRPCAEPVKRKDLMSARDIFGFDVSFSGKVTLPTSTVLLLRGDDVPPPSIWDAKPQTLEVASILKEAVRKPDTAVTAGKADSEVGKVALSHQFTDDKARRLFVLPVAIGRHAPLFNTRTTFSKEDIHGRIQRRISSLRAADQSRIGKAQEVWLDASMRPQPPELLACEPSFVFKTCTYEEEGRVTMTCDVDVRIRLKRPWFSSGEDEKLGIVLARAGEARLKNDATASQVPYTRWGADPIWAGGKGETELTKIQFDTELSRCRHDCQVINYDLPFTDAPCEADAAPCSLVTPVLLLLMEPHFDVDREEWYIDVPLPESKCVDPYVRFVLVRYQEHTAEGYEKTSAPVESWAKLLPKREVTVECSYKEGCKVNCNKVETEKEREIRIQCESNAKKRSESGKVAIAQTPRDWSVTVVVKGLFHAGPSMAPGLDEAEGSLPRIRMHLFHESDALNQEPLRRRSVFLPDDPDGHQFEQGVPWYRTSHGIEECKLVATITAKRRAELGAGKFVVFLSEFERFMPATYTDDFAEPVTWEDIKNKDTLVESGARFNARIEVPLPK